MFENVFGQLNHKAVYFNLISLFLIIENTFRLIVLVLLHLVIALDFTLTLCTAF